MGFSIDEILSTKTSDIVLESSFNCERQYLCYQQNDKRSPMFYSRCCRRSQSPHSTSINNTFNSQTADLEDDKVTRRPRTSITLCQRDFLEEEFQKERYPTLVYIDKLSRRIYLPQYVIKVWFQNRRAKYRKEGHRRKHSDNKNNNNKNYITSLGKETKICDTPKDNDIKIQNVCNRNFMSYKSHSWVTLPIDNRKTINDEQSQQCSCLKCREGTSYVQY